MPERYPDDAMLLAMGQDSATGVEYIPTGRSPYYMEFRRLIYRLLRAAERANDLRVYADGDLSVGVRAGRCTIGSTAVDFAGVEGVAVAADATTHLWLDADGMVQSGTAGLPTDRSSCIALAAVTAGPAAIDSLADLRGEAFLSTMSTAALGLTASAEEINQALDGISVLVRAPLLNALCAGPASTVDALHRHTQTYQNVAGEASYTFFNDSSDASANIALRLSLPRHHGDTDLRVNRSNGFLEQHCGGVVYNFLGTAHVQFCHSGELGASVGGRVFGVVPVAGRVSDVVLCIGDNLVSSVAGDGVSAAVRVNGVVLTSVDPALTAGDGAGFVSTAQAAGTAAVVKADGTEQVQRGDVLSVDLTRTAAGSITSEARDVVVMVTLRVDQPE